MNGTILKLKDIMIDPALVTRFDDPQELARIEEGIAIGIQPDALLVTKVGDRYVLIGGHHRYGAWLRAIGPDGEVECRVQRCPDFKSMLLAAVIDNRGNSNAYTQKERKANFDRLRKEGCSKQEARDAIGITDNHAALWEPLIRMEATSEPRSKSIPDLHERAIVKETPDQLERAAHLEPPIETERAKVLETPTINERANLRDIRFHVERLRKLLPSTWKDARAALEILADEIIKKMKETPK
jgi:ParB-like chromosome segregation protein Spo0J